MTNKQLHKPHLIVNLLPL